jgi:Family of unknown function (DUF6188)
MYKIDILTNFSSLVGKELIQVCIAHQVVLRFTDNLTINIHCPFKLSKSKNILFTGNGEDPTVSKDLICLLDETIESVEIAGEYELVIHFSNQYGLTLIDNSDFYESFVISGKEFELIC